MRIKTISVAALALGLCMSAQAEEAFSYRDYMARADKAYKAEDWGALNNNLDAAQALRPYSLYVWKNRILARQLDGRTDEAVNLARKIADRGLSMRLSGHPALEALTTAPSMAAIFTKMETNMAPIGIANIIKEINDASLLPEAYAESRKGGAYIGSIRTGKILKLGKTGEPEGIAFAQGGVFDIEIRGKKLWAAVNNQLAYEHADPENKFASVILYNWKTGAAIREIRISEPEALLGDLEVAKDGTVYASDSITPRLFKMAPGGETLDVFATDPRFANLQGIALDENNKRIFVADYLTGLFVIDTETGVVTTVANTIDAHLGGIDGLYIYKGDLIGIQNGTTPQRIVRIGLNDRANEVISFNVLQQNLDSWNEPTHGVIVKTRFNYIATSNWPSYDNNWNIREDAAPQPVRIMSVELK